MQIHSDHRFIVVKDNGQQYMASVRTAKDGKSIYKASSTSSAVAAAKAVVQKYYGSEALASLDMITSREDIDAHFPPRHRNATLPITYFIFSIRRVSKLTVDWNASTATFTANGIPINAYEARAYWDATGSAKWSATAYTEMSRRVMSH